MTIDTISPLELAERCARETVQLIDVRTPAEFGEVHATYARNLPLDQFDPHHVKADHGPIFIICRSGSRGRQACEQLLSAGLTGVFNVDGGTLAWEAAGLPVVRGRRVMSLERQVRIAAGSLVVLGCGLALTVHPYLIGLSLFVGCGLVFAGITDTCGMALVLAKLPWNRRATSTT